MTVRPNRFRNLLRTFDLDKYVVTTRSGAPTKEKAAS